MAPQEVIVPVALQEERVAIGHLAEAKRVRDCAHGRAEVLVDDDAIPLCHSAPHLVEKPS